MSNPPSTQELFIASHAEHVARDAKRLRGEELGYDKSFRVAYASLFKENSSLREVVKRIPDKGRRAQQATIALAKGFVQ